MQGAARIRQWGRVSLQRRPNGLKPGGKLLLVANRQMPYEAGLKSLFKSVLPLEDNAGYKIIEAKK